MSVIALHNADCMDALRSMPDNAYQLAIVDPPYGGGSQRDAKDSFNGKRGRFGQRFDRYFETDSGVGRFDRYKREIQSRTNGRDMGGEIPNKRGYL